MLRKEVASRRVRVKLGRVCSNRLDLERRGVAQAREALDEKRVVALDNLLPGVRAACQASYMPGAASRD